MTDCIPPPTENQALGPRPSLYGSISLALALRGGAIMRAPAKLTRWLSMERRHPPDGQIREDPPRLVPGLLDPARVAAATAALRAAIVDGARSIRSITERRVDSSDSDSSGGDDDDEEGGHPNDKHILYPPIQALETGDSSCLFFVPGSAPGLPDARQGGGGVLRLSDVHENPWILKPGTETFPGPCELTNETTRTWIMRLIITTKLVGLSKQQLHEQNWEQCFSEVAGQPLEQLLVVACSFSDARWSDVHISQMLTVFDALVDVLFNIQGLPFSRSGEIAGIVNKMVNAFKGVIQRTSNDIRSIKEFTIHPATFVLIQVLEFFCRNRDKVQSVLESGDYNTGPCSDMEIFCRNRDKVQSILESGDYNTGPCSDMVNCLISKLKECAETSFEEKGRSCIFFLNNIYYVLQKNCNSGLLPPSVVSNLVSVADQYVMSYLQEYWFPPMLLYLDGDSLTKPRHSSMDTFMETFFSICESQVTWKVQTALKEKLRDEIVKLIVPKYVKFLEALQESRSSQCPSWIKGMLRARSEKTVYTAARLEQVIRELFER